MKIPNEYIEYLQNGGETEFETDHEFGGYIVLEPIENIEKYNEQIEIKDYAPGFLAFASDGGGETFVFDESGRIYLMPLIGMGPNEAIKISESWKEYETKKLKST